VAAPGAYINVETMHGSSYRASGTSFSSPYIAGVLALWLQAHQQQAARSGRPMSATETNQAAAIRGLVATAKGVKSSGNEQFLEPVAKLGAGRTCIRKARMQGCFVNTNAW
jgi:subtilisin family serine protease